MHTAQAKGGWTCPAAKLIRRTRSCDANGRQSPKLLLLLRFLFLCLLRHGGAPLLKVRRLGNAQDLPHAGGKVLPAAVAYTRDLGQAVSSLAAIAVPDRINGLFYEAAAHPSAGQRRF
jgi:hypothetical protein